MPVYNGHETIRKAIASVASQDALDEILLTIVDDCSDESYDYLLNDFYYMNIKILRKATNTGCGQSRQYGIDHCTCEYFMFLDADDCLYSPCVVKQLYLIMDHDHLDSLYTDFIEELPNGQYRIHKNSGIWMHGKMFRTQYIRDNNVRYNYTRLHEDHAFNTIQLYCGGKNLYVASPTYLWKCYDKSLTRRCEIKSDYKNSMENYIENATYTISELCRRNVDFEQINKVVCMYILSFYRYYNAMSARHIEEETIQSVLRMFQKFWIELPTSVDKSTSKAQFESNFYEDASIKEMIEYRIIPSVTFDQFYTMLNRS